MIVRVGTTNPTALYNKVNLFAELDCQVMCLSETAHTRRASFAIRKDCRKNGLQYQLGNTVQDKTDVHSEFGSLRGLSTGVAVLSRFPSYNSASFLHENVCDSTRIQCVTVQVGQIPLRIVNLYLKPGASSETNMLNARLMHHAINAVSNFVGPGLITGGWNHCLDEFDELQSLFVRGWKDIAVEVAGWKNQSPGMTCMGVTRHTFQLANPILMQWCVENCLQEMLDLDKHDLLSTCFHFPSEIPSMNVWPHPRRLDSQIFDREILKQCGENFRESGQLDSLLSQEQTTDAVCVWAKSVESAFGQAHVNCDGQHVALSQAFLGRCQVGEPKKTMLCSPRLKEGRSGDLCLTQPAATLRCRQHLRQARRLQCALRGLVKLNEVWTLELDFKLDELWKSIVNAAGFGKSFQHWCFNRGSLFFPRQCNDVAFLEWSMKIVFQSASQMNLDAQRQKQVKFAQSVHSSMIDEGGKLAFRLIKDPQLPDVTSLCEETRLIISPQVWPTCEVKVSGLQRPYQMQSLVCDGIKWVILEAGESFLKLDKPITEAQCRSSIARRRIVEPSRISQRFFEGWNQYWQRDVDDELPDGFMNWFQRLPNWDRQEYLPITVDDFRVSIRSAKKWTMRGADSFTPTELSFLPDAFVQSLLDIYQVIEKTGMWPSQLLKSFVVFLPKEEGDIGWKGIRPITVAPLIMRLFSRIRARQLIARKPPCPVKYVGLHIPTIAHWTVLLDQLHCAYDKRTIFSGIVLDIIKASNVLQRRSIFLLADKAGVSAEVIRAWDGSLRGLTRSAVVGGCIYGSESSTTGFPEGDPLSVWAMFIITWYIAWSIEQAFPMVDMRAFADNWELTGDRPYDLVRSSEFLNELARLNRLEFSSDKCYAWSTCTDTRNFLHRNLLIQESKFRFHTGPGTLGLK